MLHDDIILIVAIVGSMSAGVLLPAAGRMVEPYILVWLGALLFLNLLRLNPSDLIAVFKKPKQLAVLSIIKLVALPAGMYALAYVVYEPFALPVLLLSGISTGLGAPFVVNLIGGQLPLVIGMIIITSVAVPFVLPSIVYAFVHSQFEIPLLHMMFLLSIALFTPLAAGWLTQKYFPAGSKFLDRNSFPLSLVFIILINWGMFAKFAGFFYSEQTFLLQTVATAFLCYAVYCLVGYVGATGSRQEKRAGLIATSYVNNVLVAVFAFQFFGSQVAALAALYNIPYYVGIIAIKKVILASDRPH
ncbi:MAG: arsenical resistance-3 family protein [Nitrososphaera sp.]|nr:arsenical resistance-3 family protein [Nitrososphaera sp.]